MAGIIETFDETTNLPANPAVLSAMRDAFGGQSGGSAAQPLLAALPRVMASLATADDASPTPFRIIGNGSSVGNAASLPNPATQSPVAQLAARLAPFLIPLGNKAVAVTNGSVDGSSILVGAEQHYPAAKVAAGGNPNLVVLAYGMNDGMPGAYHVGQTFPSVYSFGKKLVEQAQSDGADVIILTTPHPRTDVMTDAMWKTPSTPTYPSNPPVPLDTKAGSTVQVTNVDGDLVPASYRHIRVNESLRRLASDTGSVLVDAEKYWFQAVAKYGLAQLFNQGEFAHPNLLGHQESYWKAFDALVQSLRASTVQAAPAPAPLPAITTVRVDSATRTSSTALVEDNQLSFAVGANQMWEVELQVYFTGTAGDLRVGLSLPAGAGGRLGAIAAAPNSSGVESGPSTHRSVLLPDTYGLPVGANDADAFALVKGIVRTGSSAGVVRPMWSQDTSSANATTIYRDTSLRARRIA